MFVPDMVSDFTPSTPGVGPGVMPCAAKAFNQNCNNCHTMPMPMQMPMPAQPEFQMPPAWNTHSKRYFSKDSPADTSKTSDYHPVTPSTQEEANTTQNLSGSSGDPMLPQDISSHQQLFDALTISNPEPLT